MDSEKTTPIKLSFPKRIVQYFVDRKKRFYVVGILVFVMYVAQRRGYLKKLLAYSLGKVQERMMKKMEESSQELMNQTAKSNEFTAFLREYTEKNPEHQMVYLRRFCDLDLGLDRIKESLKNKTLSNQEKTKNWQAFKQGVLHSMMITMVLKSYLGIMYLIRDALKTKVKTKLEILTELHKQKEPKFLSDSIGAADQFIDSFIEALADMAVKQLQPIIGEMTAQLDWKMVDKITIDTLITRIEQVKDKLFETRQQDPKTELEQLHIKFKRYGSLKPYAHYKLIHKRVISRKYTMKQLGKALLDLATGSSKKIELSLQTTTVSLAMFGSIANYRVDSSAVTVFNYLMQEAKRRSTEKLSSITEFDEKAEDHSELIDEKKIKSQVVYEEGGSWDVRDYERRHSIIKELQKVLQDFMNEFLDVLGSTNTQLLAELGIEFQFKKLANRLTLYKNASAENQGEMLFMKILTSINKIIDEEFIEKKNSKNDLALYESRTKELFLFESKKGNDQNEGNLKTVWMNLQVAEEAKLHALIQRSTREFAARIFFDEEFERFYGEDIDRPASSNRGGSKLEEEQLIKMLSRLKAPADGQAALELD